jgi:hypothetical protein
VVPGAYHRLWHPIEKSFGVSKHDLRARPIHQYMRESIVAHRTVVFAALAGTRLIVYRTGWSIQAASSAPPAATVLSSSAQDRKSSQVGD